MTTKATIRRMRRKSGHQALSTVCTVTLSSPMYCEPCFPVRLITVLADVAVNLIVHGVHVEELLRVVTVQVWLSLPAVATIATGGPPHRAVWLPRSYESSYGCCGTVAIV